MQREACSFLELHDAPAISLKNAIGDRARKFRFVGHDEHDRTCSLDLPDELDECRRSAERISAVTGRRIVPARLDVRDESEVDEVVRGVLAEFGHIDILVNNAGNVTSTPENAPFDVRPVELWRQVIEVNLTGTFLCSKHVVSSAMKPARSGTIINLGSVAGITGKDRRVYEGTNIGGSTLDYHAAKAGVINMTRDMAAYLAPFHIRVNCLSPGVFWRNQEKKFVDSYSEKIPMGRFGDEAKELGGAVVYLASEASSYVTGHNLVVDGGLTIW